MKIDFQYLGVTAHIDTMSKKIVVDDATNSDFLFNSIFKAIFNRLNMDFNDYTVIRHKVDA